MKRWQTLLLTLLLMVLPIIGACATESQTQPTIDVPYLSAQEAISIAKREAVANYAWAYSERQASYYASRSGGWNAKYTGNGKWTVELRLRSQSGDLTIYRWTAFEGNLTAIYVGAYKGN